MTSTKILVLLLGTLGLSTASVYLEAFQDYDGKAMFFKDKDYESDNITVNAGGHYTSSEFRNKISSMVIGNYVRCRFWRHDDRLANGDNFFKFEVTGPY